MKNTAKKIVVITGLLIRSLVADANVQTSDELADTHHVPFPGTEVIQIEHCPLEDITITVMHCEVFDTDHVGDSLLLIHGVEGYPDQFDTYLASSEATYL